MSSTFIPGRPEFHLRVVKEINDIINDFPDLENLLQAVTEHLASSMQFDVVSIYLWHQEVGMLVQSANVGLCYDAACPIRLRPEEGLTGLVFRERRSLTAIPASGHPSYKYFPDSGEWEFESYLGVPILHKQNCLGVMVAQLREEQEFSPSCETLFEIIAQRLSGALEVAGRLSTSRSSVGNIIYRQGRGISQGIAWGPVHVMRGLFQSISLENLSYSEVGEEKLRLETAFDKVEKELGALVRYLQSDGKLSNSEVGIFKSQIQLLQDSVLRNAMRSRLEKDHHSAEAAVRLGVDDLFAQFGSSAPAFFRERLNDLRDIGEKLLQALLAERGSDFAGSNPLPGSILIAHELGPARLLALAGSRIGGLVTEVGGEGGHMAIIARSLGIPAVSGIADVETLVKSGEILLVDGRTGFIFVNPSDPLIREYDGYRRKQNEIKQHIREEGMDLRGCPFSVRITANIGFPGDIQSARRAGLDDVGLFRTEFAFMQRNAWPTVEEQVYIYEKVAEQFEGYLTVRTLDIGSDKQLPYFEMPREDNPMLGLRSIRFSMENTKYFSQQIMAVLKTMQMGYPVRILLPMVTQLWEVETAREILEGACNELGLHVNERPALGMMLEVPGVLYQLREFLEKVDFISLGTNDLIQYLLTVDRNSTHVGHIYCEHHPIVVRFLEDVIQKVRAAGKDLTVCGEMAGNPVGLLILLALGYRKFSVLPERAYLVRYICRNLTEARLSRIRQFILAEPHLTPMQTFLNRELELIHPELTIMD